jgi:pimeloyl-ACP methyl ester carboxylesterase
VLLHSLGGSLRTWDPVIDLLTPDRDVIAVDLPGFGGSRPLSADIVPTPAALARAVGDLLGSLGVVAPHVAGNSLGAWVALELARQGGAASVTAIAPAGFWRGPLTPHGRVDAQSLSRVFKPLLAVALHARAVRRAVLASTVARPERLSYAQAMRFVADYAGARGSPAVNRARRASQLEYADEIDVPVTVAWCEHDRLVAPRTVPGLTVTRELTLAGCGHVPMTDDPEAVARVLLDGSSDAAGPDQRVSASSRTTGDS